MRGHMLRRTAGLLLALASMASVLPGAAAEESVAQPLSHEWLVQPDYQMAENSRLVLYFDPVGLDLAVMEKATGYVWSNAVDREIYTEEAANETALSSLLNVGTLNNGSESQTVIYDGEKNAASVKTVVERENSGFSLRFDMVKMDLRFTLRFVLKEDGLDVQIPFDSIQENGKTQLNSLRLMPFSARVSAMKKVTFSFPMAAAPSWISRKTTASAAALTSPFTAIRRRILTPRSTGSKTDWKIWECRYSD